MSKRIVLIAIWTVAVILVWHVVSSVVPACNPHSAAKNNGETKKGHDGEVESPSFFVAAACGNIGAVFIDSADYLDNHDKAVTAGSTAIIALFTVILGVATSLQYCAVMASIRESRRASVQQARLTRESIDLARDEFNASHRPRIAVRGVAYERSDVRETATVSFQYVNVGDNTGWITEIHCGLMITGAEPPSDLSLVEEEMDRIELASGERDTYVFDSPELFEMLKIASGRLPSAMDQTAYLVGRILYTDAADRTREMGFCRVTQGTTRRWAVVKDSEHEYSD